MSPQPSPVKEQAKAAKKVEDPSNYCPCCSSRLTPLKCKLMCQKCGYYMSCADYY